MMCVLYVQQEIDGAKAKKDGRDTPKLDGPCVLFSCAWMMVAAAFAFVFAMYINGA